MKAAVGADRRRLLIAGLGLAFAIRLFALILAVGVDHRGDPENYINLANAIAAGQGMVLPRDGLPGLVPTAQFPPLYPLILGGIARLVPLGALTLTLVNSLFDVIAAWLLFRLVKVAGEERAALPAALLYLCWPSIALMAPIAYKEGLMIALMLALILAVVGYSRAPGWAKGAVAGLVAGLLALTQPVLAPFAALLLLAAWWRSSDRRAATSGLVVAGLAGACVMLPWWLRNWVVFGHLIPLTSSGGLALWVGAHPSGGMKWLPAPAACYAPDEIVADAQLRACAARIIAADPAGFLLRCMAKLPKSFFVTNWAMDQLVLAKGQPWPALARSLPLRLLPTIVEWLVVALAAVAAVRRPRSLLAALLWLGIAQILLFEIWFEFSERHRLFLAPVLIALATIALLHQRERAPSST